MPRPDFLQPVRRPQRLAWLALAVSACVLGLAGFDAAQAWQARSAAGLVPAPRVRVAAAPTPADVGRMRVAQRQLDRLNRPWADAFVAIETVRLPGLAWLVLDIGETGQLRLEGQAPDAETAILAADTLRHRHPFAEVLLERMDKSADSGLRFVLVARPVEALW